MKIFKENNAKFHIHDTHSSIIDDITNIIIIALSIIGFWFNYKYCGDSVILNLLLFVLCFSILSVFDSRQMITKEQLLEEINKLN